MALTVSLLVFSPPTLRAQTEGSGQALQDFFQAVIRDDPQSARTILLANTNLARVPASRYLNKLPLLVAASKGQLEIVDLLLRLGADVNAEGDTWDTGNHRLTALEVSIWYNHPAVCRRLLEAKPNLHHQGNGTGNALLQACALGREEMAGWLLDRGADPFFASPFPLVPTAPFALNITRGDGRLVPRMLKDHPAIAEFLRAEGVELLRTAASRGQVEAVAALLQAGVSTKSADDPNRPLLQDVALASSTAAQLSETLPARYMELRDLLQKGGAECDAFAATGFGDLEMARHLWATNRNLVKAQDQFGATPLHWAVETDRLPLTSFWLESGASPAATNFAGQTPVHLAAERGLVEQLDLLLAANPPLDLRDTNGWTPLDAAMQAKQTATIRRLLADPRVARPNDRGIANSLHEAAASGNIAALAGLANSTNLNARNELGLTPFQVAMQRGQLGAAAFLLDQGADVNARDPEGNTALHQIAGNWSFSITGRPSANWIARRSQDPRQAGYLRFLKEGGDDGWPRFTLQAVGFLLACGADATSTNQAGRTPVQILTDSKTSAFESERGALLKLLGGAGGGLEQRDAQGNTALHRAIRAVDANELDMLVALIAGGADVNATNTAGQTPLHLAVEKIYSWGMDDSVASPVQALLEAKANVNLQDRDGQTPLHVLAAADTSFHEEATPALLKAGANPNLRDRQGRTPALMALTGEWPWRGANECVPLLAAAGADLTVTDQQGRNLLHYLAEMGSDTRYPVFFARALIKVLAESKLDFNTRDDAGDTPLHIAARRGAAQVFEWLTSQGAKLDVTNNAGITPRFLALNNTNRFARFRLPPTEDIHEAAQRDDVETLRRLLHTEPRLITTTNRLGETPLRCAAKHHQTNAVNVLVAAGAAWDEISAAMFGRADALQPILERNPNAANTAAYGKPILHWAVESGSVPAVKLLLAAGAKRDAPDRAGFSALGLAVRSNRTEVVALLRAQGGVENLFDYINRGEPEAAVALLKAHPSLGALPNAAGLTPVQMAVVFGRTRVLAALLELPLPSAPPATKPTRFTALHVAAVCNRTNEAALLIQHGADMAALDYLGAQPLHYAAAVGAAEALAMLLRHGAKPDVPVQTLDPRDRPNTLVPGTTALHLAVLGGHTNVIAALLHAGANVNATNAMGLTAMDLASSGGLPGINFRFGFNNRLAIPGVRLLLSLPESGALGPKPAPPMLARRVSQAVVEQLEQAGAKRGKPPQDFPKQY